MIRWLVVLGILMGAGTAAVPVVAQESSDPELEAKVREVASQLRCVVCQGLSIQDSPSELAQDMKALVREQLAAGRSPEEVKEFFVARYGEWVLLSPPAEGLNLMVYVAPFIALAGGALFLARTVTRWTRQGGEAAGSSDPPVDPAV